MQIFIDESGTVYLTSWRVNRFFVICMVMPKDIKKLNRVYKIFIRKNFEILKKLDKENRMFDKTGKFKELKGSCFNRKMKENFMDFFCQNELFKVGYIILDNSKLEKRFIQNKARTFNYLLRIFLVNAIHCKYISDREIFLHIDERNVKTGSKFSLEDYLNQELGLHCEFTDNIKVKYYDSSNNRLIQVADVFSNIMYSNLVTGGGYNNILDKLKQDGYILPIFVFPKNNKKTIDKSNKM